MSVMDINFTMETTNKYIKVQLVPTSGSLKTVELLNLFQTRAATKETLDVTTTKKRNRHFIKDTRGSINDDAATLYSEWRSLQEEGPPHVKAINERLLYGAPKIHLTAAFSSD